MTQHSKFQLVAGHPALDFVDTVDWRWDPLRREDLLDGFEDLVGWARVTEIVTAAEARALTATAKRDPRSASRAP